MTTKAFASVLIILVFSGILFGQARQGEIAPDFTLTDIDGNNVTLSDIIGNGPVYINFWATWCAPCKKEIPELVKLYKEYKDRGFKVLAISIDDSRTQGKVKSFVKSYNMDFTILLDGNAEVFRRKYKARAVPYGFLLDNDGDIIHVARGYLPGMEKTIIEKMTPFLTASQTPEASKSAEGDNLKEKTAESASQKAVAPKKEDAKK